MEWSRKKGFKSYYLPKAKNAFENGGETTVLPKKILKNLVSGAKMGGFEAYIMVALL